MTDTLSSNTIHAFDVLAPEYDETFESSIITQHIRSVISKNILQCFKAGQHVLDINCGTGTDAIILAKHGIHVIAVDASAKMIDMTRSKSIQHGVEKMITAHALSFENLRSLNTGTYDGIISNLGGLNCTNDLKQIAEESYNLVKPQGIFIACVMNKICLWEIISFLLRGKLSSAFRRSSDRAVDVNLGGTNVPTWYYTPREFAKQFSPWFKLERIYGVNILSPTPNSKSFSTKYEQLTFNLLELDNVVRNYFPFYSLGDHFVVEMRSLKK